MNHYFAYGSNMLEEQMVNRCPSARKLGIGELAGFKLVFNRKGSYRAGAVASVEPGNPESDRVIGVIWRITEEDLQAMDSIEDPTAYVRISVPVAMLKGPSIYAWAYVSFPDGLGVAPDRDYINVMCRGAAEAGLPESYLAKLARWKELASGKEFR